MLREHENTRRVFIRSLGDEEHMDLVERVVAECRQEDTEYEWSYSYDESEYLANVTFGSTISRIRRTFREVNVPVVASLMVPLVTPVNEVQMKPRPMMAALIIGA